MSAQALDLNGIFDAVLALKKERAAQPCPLCGEPLGTLINDQSFLCSEHEPWVLAHTRCADVAGIPKAGA